MPWFALLLLAQPVPSAPRVAVRAHARIIAPVRVMAGRPEAAATMQIRSRPGLRLVEFQ